MSACYRALLWLAMAASFHLVACCTSAPPSDRQLARQVKTASSAPARVEAAIALAERLEVRSEESTGAQRAELLARVEALLRGAATEDVGAELQLIGINNLGVYLLKQGEAQEAVEVLGGFSDSISPGSEGEAAFLYNFGRAAEDAGQPSEALSLYRKALTSEPAFADAADVALRTARSLPGNSEGLSQAFALVHLLVEQRNAPAVERALLQSLADERWALLPGYDELLEELVRWLELSGREPAEFVERVRPVLVQQRPRLEAGAREKMDSLLGAFDTPYPLTVSSGTSGSESRGWQGGPAEVELFSRFLRRVGDGHFAAGRPDLAAQRYTAAWNLDVTYTEAALDLAAVLDHEAPALDPTRRLQAALIDRIERDTKRLDGDPKSLQYLHAVLADSLLRQGRLGAPGDPHNAIGQYDRALAAHDQVTTRGLEEGPAPDLESGLAAALRASGNQTAAGHHYLLAVHGHLVRGEEERACRTLSEALRSSAFLAPAQQSWIAEQCEKVECPGTCKNPLPWDQNFTTITSGAGSGEKVLDAPPSAIYEIFFDFDSYQLDLTQAQKLDVLAAGRPLWIEIEGYADMVGEPPYNAGLALDRARAVWQYLRERLPIKVPVEIMTLVSYGEGQARGEGPNILDRRVVVKVWRHP